MDGSTSLNARALGRVREHVEAHIGEALTLGSLAHVACLSRFHFARVFRLTMGTSPMSYVARQRVESAKRLLAEGREPLCGIAACLGYCDQSHFTRAFRKATGMTPRRYARHARGAAS